MSPGSVTILALAKARSSEHLQRAVKLARTLVPAADIRVLVDVTPLSSLLGTPWRRMLAVLEEAEAEATAALEPLRLETASLRIEATPGIDPQLVEGLVVVTQQPPSRLARQLLEGGCSVAWLPAAASLPATPYARVGTLIYREPRRGIPAVGWVARHLGRGVAMHFFVLFPSEPPRIAGLREIVEWEGALDVTTVSLRSLTGLDLPELDLVVAPLPTGAELTAILALAGATSVPVPVVLVADDEPLDDRRRTLDATDVVECAGTWLFGVHEEVDGQWQPMDGRLKVVGQGRILETSDVDNGVAELRAPSTGLGLDHIGVARSDATGLSGLQQTSQVLRAGAGPCALIPEGTPVPSWSDDRVVWHVVTFGALTPSDARAAAPAASGLIDGEAVLQSGRPQDRPSGHLPVSMDRVARRLRNAGFPVEAVVGGMPGHGYAALLHEDVHALGADGYRRAVAEAWREPILGATLEARLRELCSASPTSARRIQLLIPNDGARERVRRLLDDARETIHLQTYILDDDPVGHGFVDALIAASERGVDVRMLGDALFRRRGVVGPVNTAWARLEAAPAVQLRYVRPVSGLGDLKPRDHRKLLVVDGAEALVTGRNLGAPYYRGFDEAALSPQTLTLDVPWVDMGTVVSGPVVAVMERLFSEAWAAAGAPDEPHLPRPVPGPPERLNLWTVVHDAMHDTHTMDALRLVVEAATRRVMVVNTFPLNFELQRVLLTALRRGVEVRYLVGNVRPLFNDRQPFAGELLRGIASRVVHGRLDPLAAAGADVREVRFPRRPAWDAAIEAVYPHSHAKTVIADGRWCTLGSANVDITSGYWESELMLVVDDLAVAGALESEFEALFVEAERFDPADPAHQARAAARAQVSQHWPSLLT